MAYIQIFLRFLQIGRGRKANASGFYKLAVAEKRMHAVFTNWPWPKSGCKRILQIGRGRKANASGFYKLAVAEKEIYFVLFSFDKASFFLFVDQPQI